MYVDRGYNVFKLREKGLCTFRWKVIYVIGKKCDRLVNEARWSIEWISMGCWDDRLRSRMAAFHAKYMYTVYTDMDATLTRQILAAAICQDSSGKHRNLSHFLSPLSVYLNVSDKALNNLFFYFFYTQ